MKFENTLDFARALDAKDPLAHFRRAFVIDDPRLIYLDGNSLGRMPRKTADLVPQTTAHDWGHRLIRGWNDGWIDLAIRLGAKLAQLLGAQPGEVIVGDSTSVNLFKLATAALKARPGRKKIVTDTLNFPSDLYILQGVVDLLGMGHDLVLVPSEDGITISYEALEAAIDQDTALVTLSHTAFKSAFLYDMNRVTTATHAEGALMLWDLSHSAGAVPVDLQGCGVDLAVGCTYKYLNGGPGAPAFLYVREALQQELLSPVWGWFGSDRPFDFDLTYTPAPDITRFQAGTPPILSLQAIEPGLDLVLDAGSKSIREKSQRLTAYMVYLFQQWLLSLGFALGTPLDENQRGSHVSIRHPEGYRICRALIEAVPPEVCVIPDFRAPDNLRLGVAPLYTSYEEIHQGFDRIRRIVETGEYKQFSMNRQFVT